MLSQTTPGQDARLTLADALHNLLNSFVGVFAFREFSFAIGIISPSFGISTSSTGSLVIEVAGQNVALVMNV